MRRTFNPERLELALRRRGMTKRALAGITSITPTTLHNYCAGRRVPDESIVSRLASSLRFPVDFFFESDVDFVSVSGTSFRALSRATARQRNQAVAVGTLGILLSDWIESSFDLPNPDIPRYPIDDVEAASMAVRAAWGLGEYSIPNMIALLELQGVRVFALAGDMRTIDAFSFWSGDTPFVFLNTGKSAERTRMDAAHELGHLVLHDQGGVAPSRRAEYEAQQFASAFLMPSGSILAHAPSGAVGISELIAAKRNWNVSLTGLIVRMSKIGILSEFRYRTLMIEATRRGFRTDEPQPSTPDTSQVLDKVFNPRYEWSADVRQTAGDLKVYPEEIYALLQGLVPFPVPTGQIRQR